MENKNKIEESELIRALRNGDIKAFDLLYNNYKLRTYFFVNKIIKFREESEEIVQEVFIRIWESRSKLNENESFSAWLFKIAYNLSIDKIRRHLNNSEYIDYLKYLTTDENLDTENAVNFAFLQDKLDSIILNLPEQRRKIYTLSRKEGLSNSEIAQTLNISINTVENQITTALKTIRKTLQSFRSIFISIL